MSHFLLFLVLSGFGLAAQAQAFKWMDSEGQTQYGDQPPADGRVLSVESVGAESAPGVSEAGEARLRPEEKTLLKELESANSINEAEVLVETENRIRARCAELEKATLHAKRQVYFSGDYQRDAVIAEYDTIKRSAQEECDDIQGLVRKQMCDYFSGLTPPSGQRAMEIVEEGKRKYCESE